MGQITSRVSDELEGALTRWAAENGRPRADLIREILAEAADAHQQGRAMFDKRQGVDPTDVQHLVANVGELQIELKRVLEQNIKREAALVRSAKEDTLGVSEARTAIVSRIVAELEQVRDVMLSVLARVPAEQAAALTASPAFVTLTAAVNAQTDALRKHIVAANRWFEQPCTQINYVLWDRSWSTRKVVAALSAFWLMSVGSYFFLAMTLPGSWLAVRSANQLLGGGDQAICALVNYRMSTENCRTRLNGEGLRVSIEKSPVASIGAP